MDLQNHLFAQGRVVCDIRTLPPIPLPPPTKKATPEFIGEERTLSAPIPKIMMIIIIIPLSLKLQIPLLFLKARGL